MLIKKIVALCKKNNTVHMLRGSDVEWLGNGIGYYPQIDMPEFTETTFCSAFDFTPKAAEKMYFNFSAEIPAGFDFSDCTADEVECLYLDDISIQYGGKLLMPVRTSDGISYIDKAYLAPVMDVDTDLLKIFERRSSGGVQYFAVKNGLMVVAVIMPFNAINDTFSDTLSSIAELTKAKLENMKARK